ncbi:hypothetical protein [Streptomyces sp. NPDC057257]|uniref:hypothetical protein n=1 Tax=Streptomyces sp. NPDC057257 TaxID=3346071 RepID=UPI003639B11D
MYEENRSPEPRLRDEIRRDVIEWWQSAHPGSEPPESIRQVISAWISEQKEAIRQLPDERAERLKLNARIHAAQISELRSLETSDADATSKAIHAAHWTDNSQASWAVVLDDFIDDHPLLFFPPGFILFMLSLTLAWPYLYRLDDFKMIGGGGIVVIASVVILLLVTHGRVLAVLRRVTPRLPQFWRLVAMGAVTFLLLEKGWGVACESRPCTRSIMFPKIPIRL